MPRPKNKNQLLEQNALRYQSLIDYLDSLSDDEVLLEFPIGTLNRNIRDVLAHLHHWHLMMGSWYDEGMKGIKPKMPAEGYTWKTLPELNRVINDKYKNVEYKEARKLFEESHLKIMEIINSHTEEDLFTKKKYKWTGSTSLAAYLISNTCSHYDWATKLIKKSKK